MAHEKAYFVVVAQVGSNVMLVHRSNDKKLAYEVASGQPDGTGFVLEVSRDTDPGIAGGMEAEARGQAEQLEGKESTFLRPRSVLTESAVDQQAKDPKAVADTARRAADLKESGDRAVEAAAKKTENRVTEPDAAKASSAKPGAPTRNDTKTEKK